MLLTLHTSVAFVQSKKKLKTIAYERRRPGREYSPGFGLVTLPFSACLTSKVLKIVMGSA